MSRHKLQLLIDLFVKLYNVQTVLNCVGTANTSLVKFQHSKTHLTDHHKIACGSLQPPLLFSRRGFTIHFFIYPQYTKSQDLKRNAFVIAWMCHASFEGTTLDIRWSPSGVTSTTIELSIKSQSRVHAFY